MKIKIAICSKALWSLLFHKLSYALKTPLILIGLAVLSACSDSSDRIRNEIAKPEGIWQEHECEMAIPQGLSENDFTCGTFTVPLDLDNPDDETVGFEVAVLRARDTLSEPDPFVFLGGGPGAWNLEGYLYREAGSVLSPIAETRDIIFFDKRGNGLSDPSLFCPEFYEQTIQLYGVAADSSEDVDTLLIGYQKVPHTAGWRRHFAIEVQQLPNSERFSIIDGCTPFVNVVVASTYAATSRSPRSFSGFNQTISGKFQSLMF